MDQITVYISSTFFDLEEHRKVLIKRLEKSRCFKITSMESYTSESRTPLEVCLEDAAAADIYILILGTRYGFIPTGKKISITNLEYKKALGDENIDVPASDSKPAKIVLPFIINPNYRLADDINKRIEEERTKDGEELTKTKDKHLQELRNSVQSNFLIDNPFTSPEDLASQVQSALILQLYKDKKLSFLNELKLAPEVIYRCNRDRARSDFLIGNLDNKNFYRVFIVHGEHEELPVIFSNNISAYELQARKNIQIRNLDDFFTDDPAKFVKGFVFRIYEDIPTGKPGPFNYSFNELASRVIDSEFNCLVITIEIDHSSWKEKYKALLDRFFGVLQEANSTLNNAKTVYFLINITYSSSKEKLKQYHKTSVVLERLSNIKIGHIKQWVNTYLIKNTDTASKNNSEELAQEIIDKHFPDYKQSKGITMQETIKQLKLIVSNFNDNNNKESLY